MKKNRDFERHDPRLLPPIAGRMAPAKDGGRSHARCAKLAVPTARPVPGLRTIFGRQVFRLTAQATPGRLPTVARSGFIVRGLTDHGGGPTTDLHRLPSVSFTSSRTNLSKWS